jgi:hypothetical protein
MSKHHCKGIDGQRVRNGSVRIYNRAYEYLQKHGEGTISEIMDFINNYVGHRGRITQTSTTTQELGNILAKYPAFYRVGTTYRSATNSGRYKVALWALTNPVMEEEE